MAMCCYCPMTKVIVKGFSDFCLEWDAHGAASLSAAVKMSLNTDFYFGFSGTTCCASLPKTNTSLIKVPFLFRYRTMARAVRLGYNVLLTDNDVVMFDDFYSYFKAPPFNSFTVINQEEWPGTHTASTLSYSRDMSLEIFLISVVLFICFIATSHMGTSCSGYIFTLNDYE